MTGIGRFWKWLLGLVAGDKKPPVTHSFAQSRVWGNDYTFEPVAGA